MTKSSCLICSWHYTCQHLNASTTSKSCSLPNCIVFRLECSASFSLYQSPVMLILHVSLYYSSCITCHIVSISLRCVLRSQLVSFMSVFGIIETSTDVPQLVCPASSSCTCVSLCVLYVFQCYSFIQCSVITFTPPYQCV